MSQDVDMSHVDPRRLAEVRRRTALVRHYAALAKPSGADTKFYASRLGMSTSQFGRLVKAWREHGRLPVGEALETRSAAVTNSRRGIPAESRLKVDEVITELGVGARFTHILGAARAACQAAQVPCPSQGSIWSIVQRRRSDAVATGTTPDRAILIGRCGLDLRVEDDGGMVLPQVLIAVAIPEGAVIRAVLQVRPADGEGFATMVCDLSSELGRTADGRPILADAIASGGGEPPAVLSEVVVEHPGSKSLPALRSAIGTRLDTIGLASTARRTLPAHLARARSLDLRQARDALAHAVERHNAEREPVRDLRLRIRRPAPLHSEPLPTV